MPFLFNDTASAGTPRITSEGYLVADALIARSGIQEYLGSEVGKPEMKTVRVYRPPEVVFATDTMARYANRPMTNDHPKAGQLVDAANWKALSIGITGGEVMRSGDFVRVPLTLMDAAAIADYKSGKRELSVGQVAEVVFEDGLTPEGEPYNAKVTALSVNHVALVERARGGEKLRIGDSPTPAASVTGQQPLERGQQMPGEVTMKTVLVDGFSVQTTEHGAQAIEKLQKQLNDARSDSTTLVANHDKEMATKDAEIATLKGQVMTDAQIDARVAARADLIARATKLNDSLDFKGKTDAEVRRAVVVAKLGDAAIAGKSDEYVAARFDMLMEDGKADPFRAHMNDGGGAAPRGAAPSDNGYQARVDAQKDAWKTAK